MFLIKSTFSVFNRRLCLLVIFIFYLTPILAQQSTGTSWQASPQTVGKLSKSKPSFNYLESKVPVYTLPEVLTTQQGLKITEKVSGRNFAVQSFLKFLITKFMVVFQKHLTKPQLE